MYKTIFIGGIQRSGGSLMARLLDGHPQIASYPVEVGFPFAPQSFQKKEEYVRLPYAVPSFGAVTEANRRSLAGIPDEKSEAVLQWGKERDDQVGVRKNYLEKQYYGTVKADFDFSHFLKTFDQESDQAKSIEELFNARHKAYFEAWDNGAHLNNAEYIAMHDSSGLYLSNIEKYFQEFKGSVFLHSMRDVMGYIASEKSRLARRYFGSRRFSYPPFPNCLTKSFRNYDLKGQIRAWLAALTRIVILQEKHGIDKQFIVYGYDQLVKDTKGTMKALTQTMKLEYHDSLLEPTIGAYPWGGNSHQGKQKGVTNTLTNYYPKVLRQEEIDLVNELTGGVRDYILNCTDVPLDLRNIPKDQLQDYDFQKKHFDNEETLALYYVFINSFRRSTPIKKANFNGVLAYLYGIYVRLLHIPRMLKLRFFLNQGKQNYT